MPELIDIGLLLAGFVLLVVGGDLLVRGAVRLAERLGLSPMLIGLVIVGLGTSAPELAASVQAALAGSPGLAIGNIVGSNQANLLLVLGVTALIAPLVVEKQVLWRDGGVGLIASLAFVLASFTLGLDRITATVFLVGLVIYIYSAYRQEVAAKGAHGAAYDRALASEGADPALHAEDTPQGSLPAAIGFFVVGIGVIVAGGTLLVDSAVAIASDLGVSEAVIGLTIVAIGTSAPELVTCAIAAFKGESEIALGNVLGSNIYNLLFIGGVTGMVAPGPVPDQIVRFDLPLATLSAFVVMVFAWTGGKLSRTEGALLLGAYIVYMLVTSGIV
ncbi:calcium/sodium antiporter [Aurantiacibacter gangjinensis]|uniref:Sodium:calcium antiporter n=1 Tax=Aurantiacibacter gangjinensis TaxID=502682 RepID=A0A0G9MR48_9SPHN|nr:calcium/sodium antiporter [Aurantiacibacter gangjinensis]APE29078.1 Inner membrane protein YrbG, predicted calcium/sodium:proton antiporter [Aurantiacibacter gangjinensis]KLE33170.1 sodium:calcium antiporter [Aurantiacibacter gangjinensis]